MDNTERVEAVQCPNAEGESTFYVVKERTVAAFVYNITAGQGVWLSLVHRDGQYMGRYKTVFKDSETQNYSWKVMNYCLLIYCPVQCTLLYEMHPDHLVGLLCKQWTIKGIPCLELQLQKSLVITL